MKIKWYGHSCFLLTSEKGIKVLTDPYDPATGYALGSVEADVVTCSHFHHDHHYTQAVLGDPVVIDKAGRHEAKGLTITGIPTWHDAEQGTRRGANTVFVIEIDGMRVVHLGDLGHMPGEAELASIGRADILFAPVGGVYTIDAQQALSLASIVKPRVMIPMHYATPDVLFALAPLSELLRLAAAWRLHRLNSDEATVTPESLGNKRILLMDYRKKRSGAQPGTT
ncbi:MAG: MBL fold metallo-hydrolase [Bacillota bacterium]